MDYIEIEIKGKNHGLKFTQMALELYNKKLKPDALEASAIYCIIWAGLCTNAYRKDIELDLTFEDVCDFVDPLYEANGSDPLLLKIIETFNGSTAVKQILEAAEKLKALEKKRQVKKTTGKLAKGLPLAS